MWETIASWVALAVVVGFVIWGRRHAKGKAARLRAEGGRAALAAHLSQSVTVNTDARQLDVDRRQSATYNGSANDGAYRDHSAYNDVHLDRAVELLLARLLGGSDGRIGISAGDIRPALRSVDGGDRVVRREGPPVNRSDLEDVAAAAALRQVSSDDAWYPVDDSAFRDDVKRVGDA